MDMDYFESFDFEISQRFEVFDVDRSKLERGMYVSRIDDDVVTYDLRTRTPNCGSVMDNSAVHTMVHLFTTYVGASDFKKKVIYFGPNASRTGFVLIVRGMAHNDAIALTKKIFEFIRDYTGEIPGCDAEGCANYKEHHLDGARKEATLYLPILNRWSGDLLVYPESM